MSGINSGMMSSATPEWPTPAALFQQLDALYGPFDLDPCSTDDNAKCARHFTEAANGLDQEWTGRVFMNPPYGKQIPKWVAKAYRSAQAGALVVCLLPARTDTDWWHRYCQRGEVTFLRGRLKFGDGKGTAPFPSAVVVFRPGVGSPDLVGTQMRMETP